jgi:predicted O-methyltransferase YrrM
MVRRLARNVMLAAADTSLGRRAIESILLRKPELAVEPLGRLLNRPERFATVKNWPDELDGFDRLAFLLSSNPLNWGIAALTFDEAAHLYRTARTVGSGTFVEIGRFKGGSTFIIAAAMGPDARLYSYDLHVKLVHEFSGSELDEELRAGLARYGLDSRVELVVADSRTVPPPGPAPLIFVDGDHSYEGARADYEHWRPSLAPGGHMLFHDAVPPGGIGGHHEEVARLVAEIERDDHELVRKPGAGTIAHFVRWKDD